MIRIGIAGFGLMGRTHLNAYLSCPDAEVTALSDPDQERIKANNIAGNFESLGVADFDPQSVKQYLNFNDLLADSRVDAISICSPTEQHVDMTIAALKAGKHVLVEKPLGLNYKDSMRAVEEEAKHPNLIVMPAMCMRFWPAWSWLNETIDSNSYGKVKAATFTRMGEMPTWAEFYKDAEKSGGAILDLHIHDSDFVRFCFGDPTSVQSKGYSETTAGVDHVVTNYHYKDGPSIVTAEGGWSMKPGFQFTMRYLVNFENATAVFDFQSDPKLHVTSANNESETIELKQGEGYLHEIKYFLNCIESGNRPTVVTLKDGAEAVRLIEAERKSVETGEEVGFARGE